MGKIYCLIGKSASGKDTIYSRLIENKKLGLKRYIVYTTRPGRTGEHDGEEYFFTDIERMKAYEASGRLIEKRVYHTVFGDWYYYSVDSDAVDLDSFDYLYIATLESFSGMRAYYGEDKVIPVYIEVPDEIRLKRAMLRESEQDTPAYDELRRRFAADESDFSEEKIAAAGIKRRFSNIDIEKCLDEIERTYFSGNA